MSLRLRHLVAIVLLASVSGCIGPWADQSIRFEPVEVPAAWSGTKVGFDDFATTSAVPGVPALVAGIASGSGRRPHVELWAVTDDDLSRVDTELDLDGTVQSVDIASVAGLSVLVGSVWDGAMTTPFVRQSTDGTTWSPVDTGTALADVRSPVVGPGPDRLWVAGVDHDGRTLGASISAGGVEPVQVATAVEDVDRRVLAVRAGPAQVLTVIGDTVDGVETVGISSSVDGGATWSRVTTVDAHRRAWVGALVWLDDHWLATGGVPSHDEPDAALHPMSWTSPDGLTWTRESGYLLAGSAMWDELDGAFWLGAPLRTAARTVVPLLSDEESVAMVLQKTGTGWELLGSASDSPPDYDWPASRIGLLTVQDDGWTYTVSKGEGLIQVDRFEERPATQSSPARIRWDSSGSIGAPFDASEVVSTDPSGDGLVVDVGHLVTEPLEEGDGWRSAARHQLGEWDGTGAVRAVDLPLPELDGTIGYASATDPETGRSVVFGSHWTGDRTVAPTGWARTASASPWTPVSGVTGGGLLDVTEVVRTSSGWLAFGESAADVGARDDAVPVAWASSDGVSWAAETLPVTGAGPGSTDSCTLSGGTVLVVGSARIDGVWHATVWRRDAAGWTVSVLPAEGGSSWVDSCAVEPAGGALLTGSDGDRSTVWRTADGTAAELVWTGSETETLRGLVTVPGGYAAYGSAETPERIGPVVWFSTDAEHWSAVPVPARTPSSDGHVELVGDDLAVVAGQRGQIEMWAVRDVEEALGRAVSAG